MTPAQIAHIMSLVEEYAVQREHGTTGEYNAAGRDLEAALRDAPQAEVVAWIEHHKGGDNLCWEDPGGKRTPLYAAAPSAPTSVEPDDLTIAYMAGFADGKKARPAVEPVAYSVTSNGRHVGNLYGDIESARTRMEYLNQHWPEDNRAVVPLFATPHTAPVPQGEPVVGLFFDAAMPPEVVKWLSEHPPTNMVPATPHTAPVLSDAERREIAARWFNHSERALQMAISMSLEVERAVLGRGGKS